MSELDPTHPLHLRAGDTSLVLSWPDAQTLPVVAHWGANLGECGEDELGQLISAQVPPTVSDQVEAVPLCTLLPDPSRAWYGTPGFELVIRGDTAHPITQLRHLRTERISDTSIAIVSVPTDWPEALTVTIELQMFATGMVRQRATVEVMGDEPIEVVSLTPAMPVPHGATEILDLTGRHLRERHPQRLPFQVGTHLRETRRGRTSLQSPTLMAVGAQGFGFGAGEVWAAHVGWSGNQRLLAERVHPGHRILAGGELLSSGEVRLGLGEQYSSPWVYFSHGTGLDAIAAQHHDFLRSLPGRATRRRPVTLNTWEAVYFHHDLPTLSRLAQAAAEVGVERFVLDDGWFGGRRDDTAGLGDWQVSAAVWPEGLGPLVDRVRELGMEFGLWVEPEMVNPDSDLARAHPEWLLGPATRDPWTARNQQVLNLADPAAYAHVRDHLLKLLDEYEIAYLKWDHNRDLLEPLSRTTGAPIVHQQTLAVYQLVDELKAAHPGLEIESCSSGGGRVDLGVLARTDRVWASDCIDVIERDTIQRFTSLLVPPEMMGCHIGAASSHSTGRSATLVDRVGSAFLGHLGIEWNLTEADADELAGLGHAVTAWKERRDLLSSGAVVHADDPEPGRSLTGVVSRDRGQALFQLTVTATSETYPSPRLRLPELDAQRRYRVQHLDATAAGLPHGAPAWLTTGVSLTGQVLAEAGLAAPTLPPGSVLLLEVTADTHPPTA